MRTYGAGALQHVKNSADGEVVSLEDMLSIRRLSCGVTPLFALVEYAHGLAIPDIVFEDAAIKELQRIGTDFVLIHNDILSYQKEEVSLAPIVDVRQKANFHNSWME